MSGFTLQTLLLTVAAFFHFTGYAIGLIQPDLVSFGDFMEYHVGIQIACANVTDGFNKTLEINKSFSKCTSNLGPKESIGDVFEDMTQYCKYKERYLGCWDKIRSETLQKCGHNKESYLPAVYRATLASFCGNDNGAKTIDDLKKASAERGDLNQCSEETGIHWLENCKPLLANMISSDLCVRHDSIDKCMRKITCDTIRIAKLIREIYTDGRKHLQCTDFIMESVANVERYSGNLIFILAFLISAVNIKMM